LHDLAWFSLRKRSGKRQKKNSEHQSNCNFHLVILLLAILQACLPGQACSVTWSGTEARPRGAALARGPGECCGNRRADGEELHPSEE
jgi:hypothetical protein